MIARRGVVGGDAADQVGGRKDGLGIGGRAHGGGLGPGDERDAERREGNGLARQVAHRGPHLADRLRQLGAARERLGEEPAQHRLAVRAAVLQRAGAQVGDDAVGDRQPGIEREAHEVDDCLHRGLAAGLDQRSEPLRRLERPPLGRRQPGRRQIERGVGGLARTDRGVVDQPRLRRMPGRDQAIDEPGREQRPKLGAGARRIPPARRQSAPRRDRPAQRRRAPARARAGRGRRRRPRAGRPGWPGVRRRPGRDRRAAPGPRARPQRSPPAPPRPRRRSRSGRRAGRGREPPAAAAGRTRPRAGAAAAAAGPRAPARSTSRRRRAGRRGCRPRGRRPRPPARARCAHRGRRRWSPRSAHGREVPGRSAFPSPARPGRPPGPPRRAPAPPAGRDRSARPPPGSLRARSGGSGAAPPSRPPPPRAGRAPPGSRPAAPAPAAPAPPRSGRRRRAPGSAHRRRRC